MTSGTSRLSYGGVEFDVANSGDSPKFIFGVRKSGSSIMNSMLAAIAQHNQLNFVDVAGKLFSHGIKVAQWQNDPALLSLIRPGNIYGGFRDAPLGLQASDLVTNSKMILLVRDPRDALVSEYFSNAFTHSIPESGDMRQAMLAKREKAAQSSIEQFVMEHAVRFRTTLRQYADYCNMPGMKVYRYEEAILDKRWFMNDVCKHFEWPLEMELVEQIIGWADVMPETEKPNEFIRRVTPGDHKAKLSEDTIKKLDLTLALELAKFDYL